MSPSSRQTGSRENNNPTGAMQEEQRKIQKAAKIDEELHLENCRTKELTRKVSEGTLT